MLWWGPPKHYYLERNYDFENIKKRNSVIVEYLISIFQSKTSTRVCFKSYQSHEKFHQRERNMDVVK